MDFAKFLLGALLGHSLAVPPGPMNALIAAWSLKSLRHGFAVGAGAMSADPANVADPGHLHPRLRCPIRRRVGCWSLRRHFTRTTAFPAAVRAGWRANSRATWLAIKIFSTATLLIFGTYFLCTSALLIYKMLTSAH